MKLKSINAYRLTTNTEDSDVYIHNDEFCCGGDLVECYIKSEADKVIARHKYKRCLALARWCSAEADVADVGENYEDMRWFQMLWFQKWQKRWLALAEQFKETK